jgi:hypothetical protein
MAHITVSPSHHFSPVHCIKDAAGIMQQKVDTLHTMMEKELTYSCCDYLNNDDCDEDIHDEYTAAISYKVTLDDRAKIVDWCYGVVDCFQLDRDYVAMAWNMVDRFMSNPYQLPSSGFPPYFSHQEILHDRIMYQLLVVSALYIVIKIHARVIFSADKLADVSQGIYSVEDIEAMERTILYCLSWRVCAPTAFQVGCVILELMMYQVQEANTTFVDGGRWESIRQELAFQTENAVRDYQLTTQRPSTVAFMAILSAIEIDQHAKDGENILLCKAMLNIFAEVKSLPTQE